MPSMRSHLLKFFMKQMLKRNAATNVAERRIGIDNNVRLFRMAKGVTSQKVNVAGRPAEWILPPQAITHAVALYLHGGAYTIGSLDSHRSLVSYIARESGMRILVLDYRLAPEHPYPAAIDDAIQAFDWLQLTQGLSAAQIIILGDSAGGGLTLATALRLRDTGQTMPRGLICLSPWTDLTLTRESISCRLDKDPFFSNTKELEQSALSYAGSLPLNHPELSPVYADHQGLPQTYIQVGEDEILLHDSLDLADSMLKANVPVEIEVWPDMWHVWHIFCDWMPESRLAIEKIGARMSAMISQPTE